MEEALGEEPLGMEGEQPIDLVSGVEPRDVYILGTVFSGSTLVGNAFGIHPAAFFAGELAALPAYSKQYGVMHVIDGCLMCQLLGRECEVWTKDRKKRVMRVGPANCLAELRAETGRPVVVDGSKLMGWFRVVYGQGGIDPERTRVIITSKDPFSFADSYMRRTQQQAWEAANVWRDTYADILRTMNSARLLYTHVSYAEFSMQPEGALRRLCQLTGLTYFPELLGFRSAEVCSIGGNPGANVQREGMVDALKKKTEWAKHMEPEHYEGYQRGIEKTGWTDLKWTERLTVNDLGVIMQTPGLVDLASLLGYNLAALVKLARR
ncbi:MAG TPA: hypothetical protein VGQ57_17700 [Polyangiaceae bacterium]|jgi:hypothetical protein|nr:hypothetical protein [Polyangiaceae bacterium]